MADAKKDKLQIRNSTVDFLVFTKDAHEDGIEEMCIRDRAVTEKFLQGWNVLRLQQL